MCVCVSTKSNLVTGRQRLNESGVRTCGCWYCPFLGSCSSDRVSLSLSNDRSKNIQVCFLMGVGSNVLYCTALRCAVLICQCSSFCSVQSNPIHFLLLLLLLLILCITYESVLKGGHWSSHQLQHRRRLPDMIPEHAQTPKSSSARSCVVPPAQLRDGKCAQTESS